MKKRRNHILLLILAAVIISLAGIGINYLMAQALPEASAPSLWLWLMQSGTLCGVALFEAIISAHRTKQQGIRRLVLYLFLTAGIAVAVCWNVPRLYLNAPSFVGSLVLHLIGALFGTMVLSCCVFSEQPLPPLSSVLPAEVEVIE